MFALADVLICFHAQYPETNDQRPNFDYIYGAVLLYHGDIQESAGDYVAKKCHFPSNGDILAYQVVAEECVKSILISRVTVPFSLLADIFTRGTDPERLVFGPCANSRRTIKTGGPGDGDSIQYRCR